MIEFGIAGRWAIFAVLIVLLMAAGVGLRTVHLARQKEDGG